jgi:hypothetical protein
LLAVTQPYLLWGDNRLNRLYVTDSYHVAVRIVEPLDLPPSASSTRRLAVTPFHEQNITRLRGSMGLS